MIVRYVCRCGNKQSQVEDLSDRPYMVCRKCGEYMTMESSNED